jgi:hypothetical protein
VDLISAHINDNGFFPDHDFLGTECQLRSFEKGKL